MPNLSSMNGSATGNLIARQVVTTQDIIEGKLLADCMLEDLLSNLHNVESTSLGLKAMLYVILETPAMYRMTSAFFNKIKRSSSYLSTCSVFQKRMLLFSIVECLFSGQNLELRFTSERLTPLEVILQRLGGVWVACEKDFDEDELRKIYIQTVKQAVFMFLKNNQPVEASKILVVNRHRLAEENLEILQDFIDNCSESTEILDEIVQMPEHDYATYCAAMADFLEGVNANFEESMLRNFSSRMMNSGSPVDKEDNQSGDNSDDGEPMEHNFTEQAPSRSNSPSLFGRIGSDAGQSSELEMGSGEFTEQPVVASSSRSDVEPSEDIKKKDDLDSISPKICLSYRLKKQNRRSGIIIPCKYIVEHCRKVNDEIEDKENEGFFHFPDNRTKWNASTPVRSSASGKAGYRHGNDHRNYLLGERFEDLNVSMQSSDGRSYSKRKKVPFSLDLDSYIVAGCRHFGIGQWSRIRSSFPFPEHCTNVKIKDRFRTLIKLNHIAILDDGDFNVMNSNLKSKVAMAIEKIKHKKSISSRVQGTQKKSSENFRPVKKNVPSSNGTEKISGPSHATTGKDIDVMSMSSVEHGAPQRVSKPRFTPTEDAYLLCGARHLGLRWNILKEYFDFQSYITSSHMQERWDELIAQGKIEADDDGSEIYCHDVSLENRCLEVTNKLKKKIQKQRKSFANTMGNEENTNSESSGASSVLSPSKNFMERRRRHRVVESFASDSDLNGPQEMDEQQSTFKIPEPATPAKLHNTSVDAGTQTKKQRVALRRQSPSLLDCESTSSELEADKSNRDKSKFEAGTPIRPSALNFFKRERHGKKRKIERSSSFVSEVRERRQRELSRKQRKKVPIKRTAWTDAETKKIIDGLKKYGPGKWSQILDDGYDLLKDRTSVMIKDRFRTLHKQGIITEEMLKEWETERAASPSV